MPLQGFEGPAGTGKTHHLIEAVRERVAAAQMQPQQRILALTFMHGSRRRLDERLAQHVESRGRVTCMTIDAFANHIVRRWQACLAGLPDMKQFDQVCDACGQLLERAEVLGWVHRAFPILAVDEAQELSPPRLRIIRALAEHLDAFVAADEFQCLDEGLDTGPFLQWFNAGNVQQLQQVRRTNQQGLLAGAQALRGGGFPQAGAGLAMSYQFPAQMPFAIGHAINRDRQGAAVIVAPGSTAWATSVIERLAAGMQTPNQVVPATRLAWEAGASDEAARVSAAVCPGDNVGTADLLAGLAGFVEPPPWLKTVVSSVDHGRRAHARQDWSRADVLDLCERKASAHRAFGYGRTRNIVPVLSIHGAKNRQFRNVVVLWGPGVVGSDDYKRRLLYNAITRAELRCTVFVQTQALLNAAPFA
jgi:hypothetical protein